MEKKYFQERFQDKVILITGAANGIGRATAIRAAKEGAKVVLVDLKDRDGEGTLNTIRNNGGDAIFLDLDISKEENVEQMIKATIEKYGKLDIAINNAGVMGTAALLHELPKENMDFSMNNNFYSVYFCCKHELKQFVEQNSGGVIINNASVAGITGLPGNPAYVASKHAVNGLTKNLALDYAKFNVRVNSVNPAGTHTEMTEEGYEFVNSEINEGMDPAASKSMDGQKTQTMQKRYATSEEQAASILFLASDDSTHITGATLQTDGGWTSF